MTGPRYLVTLTEAQRLAILCAVEAWPDDPKLAEAARLLRDATQHEVVSVACPEPKPTPCGRSLTWPATTSTFARCTRRGVRPAAVPSRRSRRLHRDGSSRD